MKKRIGNDITFTWHIYRKSGDTQTPESFADKEVEVKLISPLQRPVTIEDVSIATGVVTFTFKGKHQVTLGNYVAVLQENRGENGMVTLDVVSAVTLVAHSYMEEDDDEGDVIEAEALELTSEITAGGGGGIEQQQADWAQTDDTAVDFIKNKPDLDLYCRKDMANVHTSGYDQYIKDFGESIGNVAIDAQQLWVRLLYPNGELVSETRVGPGNIRITKNGVTLNLNPAYFQAQVEAINGIEAVIPEQASSSNKLADKDFVNSSIATATATYRGSYNLVSDLLLSVSATQQQIATALATKMEALSITPDNNDYCFVQIPTADATPTEIARIDRYKYDGTAWAYEYSLNNSSFTAAQWAALNSGITSGLVAKLSALPTNSELTTLLNGKANKIPMPPVVHDLIIEGTTQVSDVITLITGHFYPRTYTQIDSNYANPAVIEFTVNYTGELRFTGRHASGGILEYIKAYVNGTLVETSTENIKSATLNFNVEANDVVKVEFTRYVTGYFTGCIGNLSITSAGVPKDLVDVYNSLAPVATSGSYNDLSDKPDLSSFITRSVDDLMNYYLKSETYTKNEVLQLIGAIQQFHYEVYPTLPQTGASNVLYLIGPTGSGSDKYEEYVYANNDWTKIGDTSIDLSGYVTTQALNTALADYVTSSALSVTLSNYYNKTEVDGLLSGKANKSEMSVVPGTGADADKTTITLKQGTSATVLTTHQDISGKENAMPITTATGATLTAVVGNYYRLDNVGTLTVTLPTITGATKLQAITFLLVCGSSALVTFAPQGTETILYQEDFALEADTTYEVTALWNGSEWTLSRVIYE